MQGHTQKQFDVDLVALRAGVLGMGHLVETQINQAISGLIDSHAITDEEIQLTETAINDKEVELNHLCQQLIALRQPTAIDLRLVMTYVRTVNDLERIGDEAKKVAMKARGMGQQPTLAQLRAELLVDMGRSASSLLRVAMDSLADLDVPKASLVLDQDEAIDKQYLAALECLIEVEMEGPEMKAAALDVAVVAKAIERIGDHAKNIAEGVILVVKGKDIRHTSPDAVRRAVDAP